MILNRAFWQARAGRMLRTALNVLILLFALSGIAGMLSEAIGDGDLPRFRSLRVEAPALFARRKLNHTGHLAYRREDIAPSRYWQALQPSVQIMEAISPPIAQWLTQMQATGHIEYRLLPLQKYVFPWRVYLSSNINHNILNIGPGFWSLSDGDKAAFLIHEYRHFRQNRAKVIAGLISKILAGKFLQYGSPLEDDAFLYQLEAYRAMELPYYEIHNYLVRRNLVRFEPDHRYFEARDLCP